MTVLFQICGFIWAIPGALMCARIAKAKGLPDKSYMLRGALYSALNFWLWFYFLKRMRDEEVSGSLINTFYIVLFVNWLLSSVLYCLGWAVMLSARSFDGIHIVIGASALGVCGIVSAVLWLVSLVWMYRHEFSYKYAYIPPSQVDDEPEQMIRLRAVHVLPCAFFLGSVITSNIILAITLSIG